MAVLVNGKEELYDLGADPGQPRDLYAAGDLAWARQRADASMATKPDSRRAREGASQHAAIRAAMERLGHL